MRRRRGRERPAAVFGRGWALALAFVLAGPGLLPYAPPARAAGGGSARVPTIYHKSRGFRIPFNVDPADRHRIKEVQLWVSEDSGGNWKPWSVTTPDRPLFTFRAPQDGEYWFAVRTVDTKDKLFPENDAEVEPSMKVVVDTTPPSLVLEPDGRRGSLAAVRWDMKDEYLDPKSLVLEYQAEGGRDWRTVPVRRPGLIGGERWDAGTAEPLKVRATVSDKAGNVAEASIRLGEGTPPHPGLAAQGAGEFASPPPVSPISSGPTFPPRDDDPARPGSPAPDPDPFPPPAAPAAPAQPAPSPAPTPFGSEGDPFGGAGATTPDPSAGAPPSPAAAAGVAPPPTQLVSSPRFPLQYAVDDAGPNGPAKVELWVTQDGGQRWYKTAEDPDRASPFDVNLGGEGTFGLRLVARSASGLGDMPPGPGDPPHLTVAVDATPPSVRLAAPVVGAGEHLGKVAISWSASDVHLGARPVTLSWRPDQPGAAWLPIAEGIENTGKFIWKVPANLPPRFHLRVDVVDEAGNRGFADTTDGPPVHLDRTRPRTRIIGLDPAALRPRAGPMR